MKYHLSAIAAVGALAAVSFAAPASAEPVWNVVGSNNLVCESITVTAALPTAGAASMFAAPGFNVRVLNKNGLAETFNVPFNNPNSVVGGNHGIPASFCEVLWTQLNEACERSNDNYSYGKTDKAYTLVSALPNVSGTTGPGNTDPVGCPGLEIGIDGTFTAARAVQFTSISINSKIH